MDSINRRGFLKRTAGATLGLTATGLLLPFHTKCQAVSSVLELVGKNYLDERIIENIRKIKQENPTLKIGETHCHTTYTDGQYPTADLMQRASMLGLDFLIITDHWIPAHDGEWGWPLAHSLASIADSAKQYKEWNHPELEPIKVYPAMELSTHQGHLIMVFPEVYSKPGNRRDLVKQFSPLDNSMISMEVAAGLAKHLGGISIIAHPNINRSYPFGVSTDFAKQYLVGLVDAIEDVSTGHGYQKNYSKELGL
ncbi:MAG: hypothetical protein A3K09_05290, partial [Nitrospinae bacterium RIFCSPLOWO2_12_FULL_47_7]